MVQRDAHLADSVGREGARLLEQTLAAAADGDEEDAVLIEAGQVGVGGEAAVEGEEADRGAMAAEEVQELEDGVGGGLAADAGVGAQEQAGIGILGKGGGEADKGFIASAGPVFLEGFVVTPVGQGREVEVGGVGDEVLNASLNRLEISALFRSGRKVLAGFLDRGIEATAGRKRMWSLR